MKNKWIKLLDEQPRQFGVYKCLRLVANDYWRTEHLKWTKEGFQPLEYNGVDKWCLRLNISHWLREYTPYEPLEEAKEMVIKVETFFKKEGLIGFIKSNFIDVWAESINAFTIVISDVQESILEEMRSDFISNGVQQVLPNP